MEYVVGEVTAPEQRTAVIAATTTWPAFPALWPRLLADVWAVVRAHDGITPDRNVMLYRDDVPNVEIGVEVAEEFEAIGRVVPGRLPAGRVARTTHRGRYEDIGRGHAAVIEWCDRRGLERAGPRWEIDGHHTEVVAEQEVEIAYLLR
jgi:effector-binding domain-containing protein